METLLWPTSEMLLSLGSTALTTLGWLAVAAVSLQVLARPVLR